MLCLNPEELATQAEGSDLALYLELKLKLEQEEGLLYDLIKIKNTNQED